MKVKKVIYNLNTFKYDIKSHVFYYLKDYVDHDVLDYTLSTILNAHNSPEEILKVIPAEITIYIHRLPEVTENSSVQMDKDKYNAALQFLREAVITRLLMK